MIEIPYFESSLIEEAQQRAQRLGALKNSITEGKSNVYGYIGQLLLHRIIGGTMVDGFDYDILCNGQTFDTKAKHCTSTPRSDYLCSVAAYNTEQKCQFYVFVRVMKDFSRAWLVGYMPKAEFYKHPETFFGKKGEVDPTSDLGWTFKGDCYNLAIEYLRPMPPFVVELTKKYLASLTVNA